MSAEMSWGGFVVTGSGRFTHPALDAVLRTASELLGMEVVLIADVGEDQFVAERLHAVVDWPGMKVGLTTPFDDTLCARLLAGAKSCTTDALNDPEYAGSSIAMTYGIRSYVGVPVHDGRGRLLATLCGLDRGEVVVTDRTLGVLNELAATVAAIVAEEPDGLVICRLPDGGWEVRDPDHGTTDVTGDLTSAMVLADLLAEELTTGGRPRRPDPALDEVGQLRLAVRQLEHALAARVVVEQALGVLTERQHNSPRESFERLRKVARSRGRKVQDLAREIVLSAQDGSVPLPPELAGRR